MARRTGRLVLGSSNLSELMACPSAHCQRPLPPSGGGQGRPKAVPEGREDTERSEYRSALEGRPRAEQPLARAVVVFSSGAAASCQPPTAVGGWTQGPSPSPG